MKQINILAISLLVMLALAVSVSAESTPVNTLSNNVNAVNPSEIKALKSDNQYSTNLFTGAASYSYPIKLVSGVNNFQPNILLSYNHHATKMIGVLGNGWGITQNYIYRDTHYTMSDTSDDIYWITLNGMTSKLIYVEEENRYHTEHESYMWIQKVSGGDNDNGEYWIVKTKDGTTYRFGYNYNSELVSNLKDYTTKWSLDLVSDTHDNKIEYVYTENPNTDVGVVYIDKINYNSELTLIEFKYDFTLMPQRRLYSQGNEIKQSGLITSIEIMHDASLVRKYNLEYELNSGVVLLNKIIEVGNDGKSTLPPTIFTYKTQEKEWEEEIFYKMPDYLTIGGKDDSGVRFIDYDSDGYTDILSMKNTNNLEIRKNNGNGWDKVQIINNFLNGGFIDNLGRDNGVRFVDINYDSKLDIVQNMIGLTIKQKVLLNTGKGWSEDISFIFPSNIGFVEQTKEEVEVITQTGKGCSPECPSDTQPIGDTYSCDFEDKECKIYCKYYVEVYNGDEVVYIKKKKLEKCDMKIEEKISTEKIIVNKDTGVRLIDVNGDSKVDILKGKKNEDILSWIMIDKVWMESNEWNIPQEAIFVNETGADLGTRFVDMNGDGMVDIVKANEILRKTWLNTGNGWQEVTNFIVPEEAIFVDKSKNNGVYLIDIDGNGLPDLVKSKGTIKKIWLNNGNSWVENNDWIIPDSVVFDNFGAQMDDINGDNVIDIIQTQGNQIKTYLNKADETYLLTNIKNSLGGYITLNYQKIADIDNTGEDDISDFGFSGYVVSSITYDNMAVYDGIFAKLIDYEIDYEWSHVVATYNYKYKNGFFDVEDKEFRGFSYVEETRPDGSIVKHYFHQDDAKKGGEYKTEIFEKDNFDKPIKEFENEFNVLNKNGYYIVKLDSTSEYNQHNYNNKLNILIKNEIELDYDDYGNVVKKSYLGADKNVFVKSNKKFEYTEYLYDTNKWIVSKPTKYFLLSSDDLTKIMETNYNYNEFGDLIYKEEWLDVGENPIITYEYNSYGNLISVTNSGGYKTQYEYESSNRFIIKEINAKGHETQYEYNLQTGDLISETDPNGYATQYQYDVFGRKTKVILPYDTEEDPTIEYTYSFDGKVPESVVITKNQNPNPSSQNHYYLDGFGSVIQLKKKIDNNYCIIFDFSYDEINKIKKESVPYSDKLFCFIFTGAMKDVKKTTYEYDALGRNIKTTNSDNTERSFVYNYPTTSVYDENNYRTDYKEDIYGNVVEVKEYNNEEIYTTTYEYDIVGNLIKINDNQFNTIIYTFDSLGRKTKMNDPDLGLWNYEYDKNSNLIKQTDAFGNLIEMAYDELGRMITKETSDETIIVTYDEETIGTLSSITSLSLIKNYKYDQRLRIIEVANTINGIEFETEYNYNSQDKLNWKKTENEYSLFKYDLLGNLKEMPTIVENFEYNYYGQPTLREYDNNLKTEMEYDTSNNQLVKIKTDDKQNLNYQYDNTGSVLSIDDNKNNVLLNMEYDDLDRLTHATRTGDENSYDITYTYNSIGNILNINYDNEEYTFKYNGKPVHSPKSFTTPQLSTQQPSVGCNYNNPVCGKGYDCVNNQCVPQQGCTYNNPSCDNEYKCVENECVPKEGCNYGNPICGTGYECQNNQCVLKQEKKVGCSYNNPSCNEGYDCINNECVLKQGCNYNNPPCEISEECVNNICISKDQHDINLISFKLMPPTLTKSDGYVVFEAIIENIGEAIAYNIPWTLFEVKGDTLVDSDNKPIEKIEINEKAIIYPVFKINKCPLNVGIWFDYVDKDNELSETNNVGYYEITNCNNLQEVVLVESINTSTKNEENTSNPYKISEDALIISKDYSQFYKEYTFNEIDTIQDKTKDKRREKEDKLLPAYNADNPSRR